MSLSSSELTDAVAKYLAVAGFEVLDIGLCGTEMVYFATAHLKTDGGIMVTASHNPADYNGLKDVYKQVSNTNLSDTADEIAHPYPHTICENNHEK